MRVINKYKATPDELTQSVYIGHGSPFGNPYISKDNYNREKAIKKFRPYFARKLIQRDPAIETAFRALKPNALLQCFCAPKICHGDVIAEYWHELFDDGLSYEENLKTFETRHTAEIRAANWLNDPLEALTDQPAFPWSPEDRREPAPLTYNPLEDGLTHINVWSKGKTELGRLASNFAHTPFMHPVHGHFSSVEGFWYWLSTGKQFNELRSLYGYDAKKAAQIIKEKAEEAHNAGDQNAGKWPHVDDFNAQIKKAILCKVQQTPRLQQLLKESTLPLAHYYVWGDPPNHKVTVPSDVAWTYRYLESVRNWLNGQAYRLIIAGSRTITDYRQLAEHFAASKMDAVEIVSGCAAGVDTLGEQLAKRLELPIQRFPANWDGLGKQAGYVRNIQMAEYADAGLLLWDGASNGTKHMKAELDKRKKPCMLITIF